MYHVAVSSHGYDDPQKLKVCIKKENNVIEGRKKIVTLSGSKTEVLEFDVSIKIRCVEILYFSDRFLKGC